MAKSKKGKKEIKIFSHICEYDQEPFTTSKPFARFCSGKCRVAYHREKVNFEIDNEFEIKELFRQNAPAILKGIAADINRMNEDENTDGGLDRLIRYFEKNTKDVEGKNGFTLVFNQYLKEKHRKEKLKK
jgi:hypothetical protein